MEKPSEITTRQRWLQYWPWAGGVSLLVIAGLAVWLWLEHPLLVNPFHVAGQLKAGTLPVSTLELMALFLPIMTLTCLGLLVVLLVFAWVSLRRERTLLQMIKSARQASRTE